MSCKSDVKVELIFSGLNDMKVDMLFQELSEIQEEGFADVKSIVVTNVKDCECDVGVKPVDSTMGDKLCGVCKGLVQEVGTPYKDAYCSECGQKVLWE